MDEASRELANDPARLGQQFIAEMRAPASADEDERPWAAGMLRWGADELDDETVWTAVTLACHLARDDGERWTLADGVVAETILMRPTLAARWLAECERDPHLRAVQETPL